MFLSADLERSQSFLSPRATIFIIAVLIVPPASSQPVQHFALASSLILQDKSLHVPVPAARQSAKHARRLIYQESPREMSGRRESRVTSLRSSRYAKWLLRNQFLGEEVETSAAQQRDKLPPNGEVGRARRENLGASTVFCGLHFQKNASCIKSASARRAVLAGLQ